MPQKGFISGSTTLTNSTGSRFLCWNLIGSLAIREESDFSAIEVEFSNPTNKKKLVIVDNNNISMGILNNCGCVFARKSEEDNMDEYEKDEKMDDNKKKSMIQFKPIHTWTNLKDWFYFLPNGESVENMAIGVDWVAIYTDSFNIRIFNFSGFQQMIFSFPQIIKIAGYENYIAYVYLSGPPLFCSQSLRFKLLDTNLYCKEVYDGILPLSPFSTLLWFGYSEGNKNY
jgi:hypothetical protein